MRLPALSWAAVIGALSFVPVDAQVVLPARGFALVPAIVPPPPAPPVAEWWRNGGPRIRLTDSRIRVLLEAGLQRSRLLRDLVARVEAGNVIVYMGLEPRIDRRLTGSLVFAGDGGQYRYLRAMINPEATGEQIIAAIAHELQHVVEVIADPGVRSEAGLVSLYRRIGRRSSIPGRLAWETEAAQQVTDDVRRELASGTAVVVAEGR